MRYRGRAATTLCLLLSTGFLVAQEAGSEQQEGRIHVNVVVSDAAGTPVSGLKEQDFTVFDNGGQRAISSFVAYDALHAKADPPAQMILVIDCVNNGFVELGYIRKGLTKFLRQNNGYLAQPTTIVRFTVPGIQMLSKPSTDGNALANIVDQIGAATKPKGVDDFSLSLTALSALVNLKANEPGRKLLVWLGPGWPTPVPSGQFTSVNERDQRADFHLMVLLEKAMQEGRIALYGGYAGVDFYMRDYLKPVRKVSEADPRDLALDVLAMKSGGHGELPAINRDSAVADVLNNVVAEANTFYSFSLDTLPAREADEFHEMKVVVDKPALTVHTITGYYDQPEYLRPKPEKERVIAEQAAIEEREALLRVSVAQLTETVQKLKGKRDGEAEKEIENLQLTERLSSIKLAALLAELPGTKSKTALMGVGDISTFLELPAHEIPQEPAPDIAEQRRMMSLAVDYLKKIIPKLPDFYAKRLTTSFEEVWTPKDEIDAQIPGVLHAAGTYTAMVYYRMGKEVVNEEGVQGHGLTTRGTFGPILSTVIVDASRSSAQWKGWEEGPNGPIAVFRFQVPQRESHYQASFATSGLSGLSAMGSTAYHGEFGIDPNSGTILRLVLEADPDLSSSIQRADIMMEYGEVEIGGKSYACPVRSVSFSVGSSVDIPKAFGTEVKKETARLNDVVFQDYHVFRTEIRIIP